MYATGSLEVAGSNLLTQPAPQHQGRLVKPQVSEVIAIPPSNIGPASRSSTCWPLGDAFSGLQVNVSCSTPASMGNVPHPLCNGATPASLPATPNPCASDNLQYAPPARHRCQLAAASDNDLSRRAQANPLPPDCVLTSLSVSLDETPVPITPAQHQRHGAIAPEPPSSIARSLQSLDSKPGERHNLSPSPDTFTPAARPVGPTVASETPIAGQTPVPPVGTFESPFARAAAIPATPPSVLLAVSPSLPVWMQRPVWSLADYDVHRRIFKGTMSAVYQATCRRSGLPVALKIYFLSRVPANATHMVAREITIHSDMVHKNIITLYGAFQEEGRLVLVQEFATRGDLHTVHRNMGRRMSEDQCRQLVLLPFLEALLHMHARGICHRDVKPENLMFTSDWRLKVGDFGVSINLAEERAVTRAGTLDYMAPEVERCPIKYLPLDNKNLPHLAYTTAVDIWAVGVLAYELLVGFPPFVVDPTSGARSLHAGAAAGAPPPNHPTAAASGTSGGVGGSPVTFLAAHATTDSLSFPSSLSAGARDFIGQALAERPEERPTAGGLLQHPWMRRALQERHALTARGTRPAPSVSSRSLNPAAPATEAAPVLARTPQPAAAAPHPHHPLQCDAGCNGAGGPRVPAEGPTGPQPE